MPLVDKFCYRPEIDGLRAVAVLAVVLFHAGFGCPGGYVGVDVFFVISGFLITSLIWKDLETGSFTIVHFWERRARRIVPALVVVTLATLAGGWFWLLPPDFASLGKAAAAQAVFGANIHYWLDSGYFETASDEKPLLHTWSLAVEEQFYLVVPFIFWGMFRFARLRTRTAVVSILTISFAVSFAMSVYGMTRSGRGTFYLLPTRAWELLSGSIVALLPAFSFMKQHRSSREFLALAGLALILLPVVFYTSETPFPGLNALPPCLGAALLILANGREDNGAPTAIGALLSIRAVVFIGLISYSLYLWHWPLLAFSKYVAWEPLSASRRLVLVGFGFLCAILSWKFVETPFRERKLGASRKSVFVFAVVGLAAVFGFGMLTMKMQGFPQRIPPESQEIANIRSEPGFANAPDRTTEDILANNLIPIGVIDANLHTSVLVWGDSHAGAALPAVDAFLKEKGLAGRAAAHGSTPPILGRYWVVNKWGLGKESVAYNDSIFSYIQEQKIHEVILIAFWDLYPCENSDDSIYSSLLTTVRQLVAIGSRPWILLNVPAQPFDVPKALSRSFISPENIETHLAKPKTANERDATYQELVFEIEAAGGHVLDPKPRFLDPTGRYYIVQSKGRVLYRDSSHLSKDGAMQILLPFLRDSLIFEKQP